jgi:hypothetical protein
MVYRALDIEAQHCVLESIESARNTAQRSLPTLPRARAMLGICGLARRRGQFSLKPSGQGDLLESPGL